MISRRKFFIGASALIFAPAIVRATSIMPVKAFIIEEPIRAPLVVPPRKPIYVRSPATGNGTGVDWNNAFRSLADAMKAMEGDEENVEFFIGADDRPQTIMVHSTHVETAKLLKAPRPLTIKVEDYESATLDGAK